MVSVSHSVSLVREDDERIGMVTADLAAEERHLVQRAADLAHTLYEGHTLATDEDKWEHALGMALIVSSLKLDAPSRIAALLFAAHEHLEEWSEHLARDFGNGVEALVAGIRSLNTLRLVTRSQSGTAPGQLRSQAEVLRKMILAMVEDVRVVILRLASRTQTLRFYGKRDAERRAELARETLDIYAPLANRLGVWQLKWELEDLSFRYLHPDLYKHIARMLDERRVEREQFIVDVVDRLRQELAAAGIHGEVYGRPKHIYSIYNKMRAKDLDFSEVYDVRAVRVMVENERDCYTVLGIVHHLWQPIPKEFDDYISHPKGNYYRSLHTAVDVSDGRALEVQIRTYEMHEHAELGVAAHWRYKEGAGSNAAYDDKIAWLRQLLSWRNEITDSAEWVEQYKRAALDDTLYVLTPLGRVIDLPRGSTPVDFAYALHTDLGHRCRGAKLDGVLVPLNTPLETGQRVEILSAKQGGPSRDWLTPGLGYIHTSRARNKVRQWFARLEEGQMIVQGRAIVTRELQREGAVGFNLEVLAHKAGYARTDDLFLAAARNELTPRLIQQALRGAGAAHPPEPEPAPGSIARPGRAGGQGPISVVGLDSLLTELARCCKPVPPDDIVGFITRAKGVSIHRPDCRNYLNMAGQHPERVIDVDWGGNDRGKTSVFAVDVQLEAVDRQGLLRDISEAFSRERINVTAVRTLSRQGHAYMAFTMEVSGVEQLQRALVQAKTVPGVLSARRV